MTHFYKLPLFLFLLSMSLQAMSHPGFDDEIDHITERIHAEPDNAELYWLRGDVNRIYKHWDRALADFQEARRIDPELYKSDLGIGRSYFDQSLYLDAITYLNRFLAREPGNIRGLLARARAWHQLDRNQRAAGDYTLAIEQFRSPKKPTPVFYLERAKTLEAAGDSYLDDAVRGLEEGLRVLGPIITLELYIVDLETKRNNYDAALQRMDRVIEGSARKDVYLVKRSKILMQAGREDEARQDLRSARDAIERLPNSRSNSRAVKQIETRIHQDMDVLDTNQIVEEHKL